MKRLAALVVLLHLAGVMAAGAQSLADVARKEEQRRKAITKPAKVYTNKDLGQPEGLPPPSAPPAAAASEGGVPPAGSEAGAASADGQPAGAAKVPSEEEERAKQEASWRGRIQDARAQLDRSRMFAEALQTRANSLWADFTARDDPAQRAVIEADRRKTLAALDRVKGEIEAQTKAIADLEEEARRAGVPPGWLR